MDGPRRQTSGYAAPLLLPESYDGRAGVSPQRTFWDRKESASVARVSGVRYRVSAPSSPSGTAVISINPFVTPPEAVEDSVASPPPQMLSPCSSSAGSAADAGRSPLGDALLAPDDVGFGSNLRLRKRLTQRHSFKVSLPSSRRPLPVRHRVRSLFSCPTSTA